MSKPWEEQWRQVGSDVVTCEKPEWASRVFHEAEVTRVHHARREPSVAHARARLAAAAPDLARALLAVEWGSSERGHNACPACAAMGPGDHCDGCQLDAALRKAGIR
jgi:hypothetical protein